MLHAYAGDTATAMRHLHDANRLSPIGVRINFLNWGRMVASFVDADYAAVLYRTAEGSREDPNNIALLRYRTAALALLGRLEEARETVNRMLALNPELTIQVSPARRIRDEEPVQAPRRRRSLLRGSPSG